MTKQRLQKLIRKTERGQAVILIAFAIIGLVAMVGLVTDTGILLIEYGKLKRGVDAAAVAAAQQYRLRGNVLDQAALENAAKNFLQLNQSTDIVDGSVIVHSCESPVADRPVLCNPDPLNHPNDNRKLVEVIATKNVYFGFLRVIGIESTTVTANAVGEAATIDLVLVIDTSASMAFETDTDPTKNDFASDSPLENPSVCNTSAANPCQPLRAVKNVALDFINTLYFPYDRVAIVTMTSQAPGGDRYPREILALTSDKADILSHINNINVFEPQDCNGSGTTEGSCLNYINGNFAGTICEIWEKHANEATADPSSCPSSNIGGALDLARVAFTKDPLHTRLDAFWVVVSLLGGPANATDILDPIDYPNGFCPQYTWTFMWDGRFCQDKYPSVRHADTDVAPYDNPVTPGVETDEISMYDPDDYARDRADDLAKSISGEGVTIFTIGLGKPIKSTALNDGTPISEDFYADGTTRIPPAEALLQYIAECAGDGIDVITYTTPTSYVCDPSNPPTINHGQYFYAPTSTALADIFDRIAKNIATKISQ
ncbi:MAG: VWA domain-containing protein [Anaerolineales bacterium]|nr:VWA domain-containing protein [Anaerolineales bacterium]